MKQLTKRIFVLALLIVNMGIYSCKKEAGPKGDTGNANVTQINFGSKTFPAGGTLGFTLAGITKSIAETSIILSYGKSSNNLLWYQLPGFSNSGLREYRTYLEALDPSSKLNIVMATGTSPETFDNIRVLIIPANSIQTGMMTTNLPFDASDYEAVRKYFHLPE